MRRIWWLLASFAFVCMKLSSQDTIEGCWKSFNEKTGIRQCVVAIYPYEGKYYGRIIATFDKEGNLNDRIEAPVYFAPGIQGQPPYCGLDLIWDLVDKGPRFDGKIVDPKRGKVYDASVWRKHQDLIIRGKLFFFGRNITWAPATEEDLPPDFKKESIATFVPKIPKV